MGRRYFRALSGDYVAAQRNGCWISRNPPTDDETLFENFLNDEDVFPFEAEAVKAGLNGSNPKAVANFLDAVGQPVKKQSDPISGVESGQRSVRSGWLFYSGLFLRQRRGGAFRWNMDWPADGRKNSRRIFRPLRNRKSARTRKTKRRKRRSRWSIDDAGRDALVQSVLDNEGTSFATRLLEDTFDITNG